MSGKKPHVTVFPANPTVESIAQSLQENGVVVSVKQNAFPDSFQVSEDAAVLVLHSNQRQRGIADIYEKIDAFLGDYPEGIVAFHKFPKETLDIEILGLFMRVCLDFGKGVIPTLTTEQTALTIKSLAKRVQIKDKPPSLSRVKPAMKTIADAQKFFLEGLVNCGPTKVETLMESCDSPMSVVETLQAPANRKTIEDIDGFGPKFTGQNAELVTRDFSRKPKKSLKSKKLVISRPSKSKVKAEGVSLE